jgi:hypothetical protein
MCIPSHIGVAGIRHRGEDCGQAKRRNGRQNEILHQVSPSISAERDVRRSMND